MARLAGALVAPLACLAWATGCSDSTGPGQASLGDLPGLIVSQPVGGSGGGAGGTLSFKSLTGAGSGLVYVSMVPGTVPTGLVATIRDQANGQSVTAPVVDGGFDPVPVPASVGDTLVVEITRGESSAPLHVVELVRARHPPIVVRTDPPTGGRDVPLNASIVVVFSDPIDPATLNTTFVRLYRDTTLVAGTVPFTDSLGLRAEFHPDGALASGTSYRLVITTSVRDVDGTALDSTVEVRFTTAASPLQARPPGLQASYISVEVTFERFLAGGGPADGGTATVQRTDLAGAAPISFPITYVFLTGYVASIAVGPGQYTLSYVPPAGYLLIAGVTPQTVAFTDGGFLAEFDVTP